MSEANQPKNLLRLDRENLRIVFGHWTEGADPNATPIELTRDHYIVDPHRNGIVVLPRAGASPDEGFFVSHELWQHLVNELAIESRRRGIDTTELLKGTSLEKSTDAG